MPVHRHPLYRGTNPTELSNFEIDHELVGRLRDSYQAVRATGDRLAVTFYRNLFAQYPGLRPMFKADPAEQAAKLMASLDIIIAYLADPGGKQREYLAELGRRHTTYGVVPAHYDAVIQLLCDAMKQVLTESGHHPSQRTLDEWRTALRLVSDHMLSAAQDHP